MVVGELQWVVTILIPEPSNSPLIAWLHQPAWCFIAHEYCFGTSLAKTTYAHCNILIHWTYGKAGNGNEMETGNGNWKSKLETEMGTNNAPIPGAMFSSRTPSGVLCHYSCILLSSGHMTGL